MNRSAISFPEGAKVTVIEPGEVIYDQKGAWLKLDEEECRLIRSFLRPARDPLERRLDAKVADAQEGVGWR